VRHVTGTVKRRRWSTAGDSRQVVAAVIEPNTARLPSELETRVKAGLARPCRKMRVQSLGRKKGRRRRTGPIAENRRKGTARF
jgi:hypothetical protein